MAGARYGQGLWGEGEYGGGRDPLVYDIGGATALWIATYGYAGRLREIGGATSITFVLTGTAAKGWQLAPPCYAGTWALAA